MAAIKVPADLDAWLSKNDSRIFDELNEFLRIPSVSARSEHDADTRRAAAWLHEKLTKIGFTTETIPTAGLVVMPNCGHAINLEAPDEYNRQIDDFLHAVDLGKWPARDPRAMSSATLGR